MGLPPQSPGVQSEASRQGPGGRSAFGGRIRAYVLFVAAVFYHFLARSLALHGAQGFFTELWTPLAEQLMLAFLLLVGYAAMGFVFQHQIHPISEQGLPRRSGFLNEFGMGLAIGWGIAIVCIVPLALAGGIAVAIAAKWSQVGWFLTDGLFFLAATLAEEIAYRGYAFQCFRDAVGQIGAAIGVAFYYAIVQMLIPGSNRISFVVSFLLGLLLSTAYLRTKALWVSWGINFGWKASRAMLFGLVVCGVSSHSSVVQGDPMGPFWLTGGGFGLDGTWIAFFVLLAAFPIVMRITRDLDFRYNAPVIVSGGIPVDLDAAARAQHEAVMGPPAVPLVQITPVSTPAPPEDESPDRAEGPSGF